MEEYLLEVHNSLVKNSKLKKDENDLLRAGLRVPLVRKHLKNNQFSFLELSDSKILNSWDFIWKNSECFEVMSMALYYYQGKSLSKSEFQKLKTWNKSKNPWMRRQSIVSLIEYASKRKKVLAYNDLISYIKPLLDDKEYYVQKGLGWTIREIYNLYPKEALKFIENNLEKISPVAYSVAIEKLDGKLKKTLNEKRKEYRKRNVN